MTTSNGLVGAVENEIMANSQPLEPRWPAILALLAVGGLRLALPETLSAVLAGYFSPSSDCC